MIKIIAGLLFADIVLIPFLLFHIRRTGAIHLTLSTLHKFIFLSLVTVCVLKTGSANTYMQLFYTVVILLLADQTFEINQYLFKMFDPSKYDAIEGTTPEAKALLEAVIRDIGEQNAKNMFTRIKELVKNFFTNIFQDLGVIYMLLTDNKSMKNDYKEIHAMVGNNMAFKNMSFMELLFMLRNRVIVNCVVLIFLVVSL